MRLSNAVALPLLAAMTACGKRPVEPRSLHRTVAPVVETALEADPQGGGSSIHGLGSTFPTCKKAHRHFTS